MSTTNLLFVKSKQPVSRAPGQEVKKCSTCSVTFADSSAQKSHFKSEWHLYNVKRKNSQLHAISFNEYQTVKDQIKEMLSAKVDGSSARSSGATNKTQDLKPNGRAAGPRPADPATKFDANRCLFNSVVSKSIADNVKYMERQFTFFLPEKEYISDLEGLLRYLHKKIYEDNACLYCDRLFSDHYATLHHMNAKQHVKVNDDRFDQISPFYDFTTSYVNLILEAKGSSQDGTPSAAGDGEDEWEDLFSTTSSPSRVEDLLSTYGVKRAFIMDNGNLSLPNGKEAVHRELSYIYKQNLVVHNPFTVKSKQDNFNFKRKGEKRQIILSEKQKQYREGRRDLNVAVKSYRLFVPVRQDICFG